MKARLVTLLAAVTAGALALSSCGSSANPLDSDSSTSEQSSSQSSSQSSEQESTDSGSSSSEPAASESSAPAENKPIVIGSANFVESELIAGIYAAALKAKGVDASTHLDIGSREVYLQALEDGSINLMPEYTGGVLAYYNKDSQATAPDDVYDAAKSALPSSLEMLEYSKAEDKDSITVTKETADKYKLESIGDLAPYSKDMSYGASPEMQTRPDGPEGLEKLYGVVFKKFVVLDPGGPLSVKGLTTGLVQVADIFTTDPQIVENNFVVLKDPKNLYQAQNIVPLIQKDVASPVVADTLNAVSAKLTTDALIEMQKTISEQKADPVTVGAQWVKDNGLG